jgi:hypothetical protein
MAGAVQLLMATAHAQAPAVPVPPPPVAPAPAETPSSPPSPSDALIAPTEIPTPPAGSAPASPPKPPAATFPTVTVIADSNKTILQKMTAGDWEMACWAPCRRGQDPNQAYRVAGRGLYPSDPFRLPAGAPQVEIKARMGSKGARIAGIVMVAGGLAGFALNGLVLMAVDDSSSPYDQKKVDKGPLVAGMVIGGLVALVGLMIGAGAHTKVAVQDHLSPPPPPVE